MEIGDQNFRVELAVESGDRPGGRLVMRAEDQPVGMHEVVDRASLSQELGVGDDMERDLVA